MADFCLRKMSIVLILCLGMSLLTGCWDRHEINNIAIVLGAGLDKGEDNNIQLTVQLAIPNQMGGGQQDGGGGGEHPTVTKQATGTTIFEAMSRLQEELPSRIFWGHNQAVIFGEKLAEEGIFEYIDFFAHHPQPRIRAVVLVSKDEAKKALDIIPYRYPSSSIMMRDLMQLQTGMMVTVKDVLQMLRHEAEDVAIPWIEATFEEEKKGKLDMNGTAVFKEDKMIGKINSEITRGVLWLRDEIDLATVTFKPENAEGYLSAHLIHSTTELIPSIDGDTWKITAKIVTEDDIMENQTTLDLSDEQVTKKIAKKLEESINQRIRRALEQVQKEMKADIIMFQEAFHRKYPKEFSKVEDRWDEIFPEIEVEIDSKSHIRRVGVSTNHHGEEEVKDE